MKKDFIRRVLLVAVSVFNWIFSIGYIREIYNVMFGEGLLEYTDEINIFTLIVNFMAVVLNGLMIILIIGLAVLFATILILISTILLRVTTIRKKDVITESELVFTKWFLIISSIIAFFVGILSTNIKQIGYVLCLSWQQPLFMMLIYYLPLKKQFKNECSKGK